MEKLATAAYRSLGRITALLKLGFSEPQVSGILIQDGLSKEAAAELVKEALPIGAMIGGAIRAGGRLLAGRGAGLARAGVSRAAAPAAQAGAQGLLGRGVAGAQQAVGRAGLKAGRGLASSGRAFQQNPLGSLGRGTLEAGKGALFMGGKGLGGVVGKGMFGASLYNSATGPQQMQMPQAYGGLTRPYPQ